MFSELERGVCFLISFRPNIWQPVQSGCGILDLGTSVVKLKEGRIDSPSSRQPVLEIQMPFFEVLAEEKNKSFEFEQLGFLNVFVSPTGNPLW